MRSMQIESVLQIKNRSEPAKNRFSVALPPKMNIFWQIYENLIWQQVVYQCLCYEEWQP